MSGTPLGRACAPMKGKLVLVLLEEIIELIKHSGANEVEASCALKAAESLVPEMDLCAKPTLSIQT